MDHQMFLEREPVFTRSDLVAYLEGRGVAFTTTETQLDISDQVDVASGQEFSVTVWARNMAGRDWADIRINPAPTTTTTAALAEPGLPTNVTISGSVISWEAAASGGTADTYEVKAVFIRSSGPLTLRGAVSTPTFDASLWTGIFGLDFTVQIRAKTQPGGRLGQTQYPPRHPQPKPTPVETKPVSPGWRNEVEYPMTRNGSGGRSLGEDENQQVRGRWVLLGNREQRAVAHLGRRLLAKLLDILILLVILVILEVLTYEETIERPGGIFGTAIPVYLDSHRGLIPDSSENPFYVIAFVWALLASMFVYLLVAFYDSVLVAALGYTPGKRVLGIRIVSLDGSKPRFRTACGRWIALHPPWGFILGGLSGNLVVGLLAGLILILIVYLSPVWNNQRRGWHDRLANTVVVNAA